MMQVVIWTGDLGISEQKGLARVKTSFLSSIEWLWADSTEEQGNLLKGKACSRICELSVRIKLLHHTEN